MKFTVDKSQRDFYQKFGWIEFDDFLSKEKLAQVNDFTDQVMGERLNVPTTQISRCYSDELFVQGHDLWRSLSDLKKFISQPLFGTIASELIEKKPLRLGYDQLIPAPLVFSDFRLTTSDNQKIYQQFKDQTESLEKVSSINLLLGGAIICLNGEGDLEDYPVSEEGINVFPSKPGQIIFFKPGVPIRWNLLDQCKGQHFYLIVYTEEMSFFQPSPLDPHARALKKLGYVMHDKLTDKLNPIVYR
ncbi:MAG: hypothetical protein Q8K60_08825 [Parachlamydiaceae bacterium]|nr:hypothetical protein [Parachlamydiaceae bacterium]